ncbi:MAG: amidohydrolase family protein [Fulvivirga sp.]
MKTNIIILALALATTVVAQAQIIDMHVHSYTEESYWGVRQHQAGFKSPESAEEHMKQTIAQMDKHNIEYAVVSGNVSSVDKYVASDSRFIPGYSDEEFIPIVAFEQRIKDGKIKVFGEIGAVYQGRTLADSVYAPYLRLCEQYDIPVAYHTGGGPPSTPYTCCPKFRISFGDPLLIEDVLVKYPKLRIYLMHGGEVFFEHALRMMKLYPQLYVDLGVLLWVDPIVKDYAVRLLKQAKQVGLLDRVMFGSDQMVWPDAINRSVAFLNAQEYLSEEEKTMIFYENAKRFLKIE